MYNFCIDKEAFEIGEKITDILNVFSHNLVTDFVESACWPDDVKKYGMTNLDTWHYLDLPVRYPKLIEKQNITYKPDDALGTLVRFLKFILSINVTQF